MGFLWSFFFAAGVATFVYTKMGRSIGFGNSQTLGIVVGVVFVVALAVFYSLTRLYLHSN